MLEPGLEETVFFTIATEGFVPFVLNLHASLKRLGLANQLVVYSLDDGAQSKLSGKGIRSSRYAAAEIEQPWSDFRAAGYTRIVSFKYAVALDILNAGKNAFFMDSDIVFLRNPVGYLRRVITESAADLVMQSESPKNVYCTGFWFATPTRPVIDLFSTVWSALQSMDFTEDQNLLNESLSQARGLSICGLDPDLFACGNRFLFSERQRAGYGRGPFDARAAYILHFNYVAGRERKVAAMVKHNAIFYPGLARYGRPGLLSVAARWIRARFHQIRVVSDGLVRKIATKVIKRSRAG